MPLTHSTFTQCQPRALDTIPPGGILGGMKHHTDLHDKQLKRRLKIIEGQVRGLHEMVERGVYCIDIITQTSAVKRALAGFEDTLMENHLKTCAIDEIKRGDETKAVGEILKVYKLKRTS